MVDPRDRPLFAWGQALRAARARRRRLTRRAAYVGAGISALALTVAFPPRPWLVWNASASAPLGLYAVLPVAQIKRGDMILAWPPPQARRLAAQRHYLPATIPLIKRVAARNGDLVCASGDVVFVNGKVLVNRLKFDSAGRPLPQWRGCVRLDRDMIFLAMPEVSGSFDGRYFGPTARREMIGREVLLWPR
ncbi:S26 family signal peptidase [Sphingobium phenoxybenzoativorans]|uniref:S26 family signal peptidase n=1 Tax=Sphingobium phenoxybenzoativorans TaxID=1592790 RepID=UPI0008729C4C|nr:S26 family signal peptidase [Sphingobium phenoxybenzoativorans]